MPTLKIIGGLLCCLLSVPVGLLALLEGDLFFDRYRVKVPFTCTTCGHVEYVSPSIQHEDPMAWAMARCPQCRGPQRQGAPTRRTR